LFSDDKSTILGFTFNKNMGGYDKTGRSGGYKGKSSDRGRGDDRRSSYGDKKSFGGRDSGSGEMFDATCDECGKNCRVPFRPSGSKPVYCNDCFRKHNEDGGNTRDFAPRSFSKPSFESNRGGSSDMSAQLAEINQKLDRLMKAIIRP